ncbi:MAG: SulP family inorganic anion transporter [Thermomicrobiales bacterium]|nr:SulP family inorganic anion transporter [Thermomicrobiales bacterium]
MSSLFALDWGRTYNVTKLRGDAIAGVTIAAIAIPEDMAYATMAGLPPQIGLYSSLIALIMYAILGTSTRLAYGTTSALSIMVAGSLGAMGFVDPADYLKAASFVAISAGAMALVAWILRLGALSNFVSETVLVGFSAGAALYIGSSQLSKLFGIHGVQGNFFERIWNVISHLGDTNVPIHGGAGMFSRPGCTGGKFHKLPIPLFVVVGAIILMAVTDLESRGVEIAGEISGGLPRPTMPTVPIGHMSELLGLAFGVFLLSYVEGVGVARSLAAKNEKVDPAQELLANSATNLGSGLFGGYAVGGSMSRSAVKSSSGAATPASGGFTAAIVVIVLLFLTAPFELLPEATLAAGGLVAVRRLFNVNAIMRIWQTDKREAIAVLATFMGVLVFGMLEGILIGVRVTFVLLLIRVSQPGVSILGQRVGTTDFVDVKRSPDAVTDPDVLIVRPNSGLFYANASKLTEAIASEIVRRERVPDMVVIDMAPSAQIDLGAIDALRDSRGT